MDLLTRRLTEAQDELRNPHGIEDRDSLKVWKFRTQSALAAIFGKASDISQRFSRLSFYRPSWDSDVKQAQALLSDALEGMRSSRPPATPDLNPARANTGLLTFKDLLHPLILDAVGATSITATIAMPY